MMNMESPSLSNVAFDNKDGNFNIDQWSWQEADKSRQFVGAADGAMNTELHAGEYGITNHSPHAHQGQH